MHLQKRLNKYKIILMINSLYFKLFHPEITLIQRKSKNQI